MVYQQRAKEANEYHRIQHQRQRENRRDVQDSKLIIKFIGALIVTIFATWYLVTYYKSVSQNVPKLNNPETSK